MDDERKLVCLSVNKPKMHTETECLVATVVCLTGEQQ